MGFFVHELAEGVDAQLSRVAPESSQALGQMIGQLRQSVSKIQEHGRRATQIINGMLMHSRESSEAKTAANLNSVLAESIYLCYRGFCARVPDFELSIESDYDPKAGEVEMVASEISRVFINSVDNACYALRQKKHLSREPFSPRLEVRTLARGEHVEIRIRDNGTGIPELLLGKVFNPFFLLRRAATAEALAAAALCWAMSHCCWRHRKIERDQGSAQATRFQRPDTPYRGF